MSLMEADTTVTPMDALAAPPTACSCKTSAGLGPYVYALGQVDARFPRLAVEKEFAQITGRSDFAGRTDRQVMHDVLSKPENRYLARQMCWVFSIEGLDTYVLQLRDAADLNLLTEAIRPRPSAHDVDLIIGTLGEICPPNLCNGLMAPIVTCDQIYSFDRGALLEAIPMPEGTDKAGFGPVCDEVFDRLMFMADNAGATDEMRALNYAAVRYPAIYGHAAKSFEKNCTLTAVETRPSRLSSTRKIIDVIFSYTDRTTDVTEKVLCRIDVTELFPFLVTKLSPYYDL